MSATSQVFKGQPAQKVKSLYRQLLRQSNQFPAYNFREYARRRTRDAFRDSKDVKDAGRIEELYQQGLKDLQIMKRQTVLGQFYQHDRLVIENGISGKETGDGNKIVREKTHGILTKHCLTMAPGTRRGNRSGYPEHDDFEGLPVRQWRQEWVTVAPAAQVEAHHDNDIWARELPYGMPKDSQLLAPHSLELLRAARSGRLYKRPAPADDDDAELDAGPEKADKKEDVSAKGYSVKVWKQVPRNAEGATISYLAKRRKNTVTLKPKAEVLQSTGSSITRATIRRVDAAGNPYEQTITLTEGQPVDGEIISTSVVPMPTVEAALPAQQTTPLRRKPPPPRRKPKGPGRGRKKGRLPLPASTRPPSSVETAEGAGAAISTAPGGVGSAAAAPLNGQAQANSTQTQTSNGVDAAQGDNMDQSAHPSDDEDGDEGDDGEDGDEGDGDIEMEGTSDIDRASEPIETTPNPQPQPNEKSEEAPEAATNSASDISGKHLEPQGLLPLPAGIATSASPRAEGSPLKHVALASPMIKSPVLSPKAEETAQGTPAVQDSQPKESAETVQATERTTVTEKQEAGPAQEQPTAPENSKSDQETEPLASHDSAAAEGTKQEDSTLRSTTAMAVDPVPAPDVTMEDAPAPEAEAPEPARASDPQPMEIEERKAPSPKISPPALPDAKPSSVPAELASESVGLATDVQAPAPQVKSPTPEEKQQTPEVPADTTKPEPATETPIVKSPEKTPEQAETKPELPDVKEPVDTSAATESPKAAEDLALQPTEAAPAVPEASSLPPKPPSPPLPPTKMTEDEDEGPDLFSGLEAQLNAQDEQNRVALKTENAETTTVPDGQASKPTDKQTPDPADDKPVVQSPSGPRPVPEPATDPAAGPAVDDTKSVLPEEA
ncbi:uncharacterized protein PpBr36_05662 [Pyricularia pennisetigena]|uniref:uncharacterized protein n=1 Tax=Pyricularia pennisetigena TaxID=1578925 RepID=UPI001152CD12|nr:uncharacterized protein PpBr36_05662 [Pyricularia pennisetigena]TLS23626.1 hypothetical protein PpBr36_05662 [Pyricularia pennisetigena]